MSQYQVLIRINITHELKALNEDLAQSKADKLQEKIEKAVQAILPPGFEIEAGDECPDVYEI